MQLKLNFLNNLKIQWKLLLIPLAMAVPIAFLVATYYGEKSVFIQFNAKENLGVDYIAPLKSAHRNLARYRDATNAMLRGAAAAQSARAEAISAVDKDLATIEALDQKVVNGSTYGAELEATNSLKAVQQKWGQLKNRAAGNAAEIYNENTQLLSAMSDYITLVSDKSNLTLDPEEDSYYFMDMMVWKLTALTEQVSSLRGLSAGVLAAKAMTAEERAQIGFLQSQIEASLTGIKKNFEKALAFTKNTKVKENWAGRVDVEMREVKDFLNYVISQTVNAQELNGDVLQLFSRGTQLSDRLRQLDENVAADLFQLIEARVGKIAGERTFSLLLSLLGLIAAGLITYLVTRAITQQTSDITNLIVEVEKGNFEKRISTQSNDELGRTAKAFNNMLDNTKGLMQSRDERDQIQNAIMRLLDQVANVADGDLTAEAEVTEDMTGAIADSFNFMIVNLRELIGKVKEVSYQVNASTSETANFTERLAQGSQEQAERIAQTSTALNEMSAQIVRVSQTADSSAQVAEQSLSTARKGAEAVSNTVEGMTRIQEQVQETARRIRQLGERSQEIEEIVRLIEEIADRTSVLALNASIQAAAAGDAGHGFSVVAAEVEQLAGRSAGATKRIGSLIRAIQSGTTEAITAMEEVKREVISGSRVAHSAGESLREIEAVSNQLAQLVRSISHATQQQARGSEALSNTMTQLAQQTNQTTTGVMQSALTVKNLAILADDLRASVASFKVADNDEGLSLSGTLPQAALLSNAAGRARR